MEIMKDYVHNEGSMDAKNPINQNCDRSEHEWATVTQCKTDIHTSWDSIEDSSSFEPKTKCMQKKTARKKLKPVV